MHCFVLNGIIANAIGEKKKTFLLALTGTVLVLAQYTQYDSILSTIYLICIWIVFVFELWRQGYARCDFSIAMAKDSQRTMMKMLLNGEGPSGEEDNSPLILPHIVLPRDFPHARKMFFVPLFRLHWYFW